MPSNRAGGADHRGRGGDGNFARVIAWRREVSEVVPIRRLGAMPLAIFARRLSVGASLMAGTCCGKVVVLTMSADFFRHVLDAVMGRARFALVWQAVRG